MLNDELTSRLRQLYPKRAPEPCLTHWLIPAGTSTGIPIDDPNAVHSKEILLEPGLPKSKYGVELN